MIGHLLDMEMRYTDVNTVPVRKIKLKRDDWSEVHACLLLFC